MGTRRSGSPVGLRSGVRWAISAAVPMRSTGWGPLPICGEIRRRPSPCIPRGRARASFWESLRIAKEIGDREIACWDLEGLAALDAAAAQEGVGQDGYAVGPDAGGIAIAEATGTDDLARRAARLLGAAGAMRE